MNFKIKTAKLNSILSSVEKGVGAVKVLPITEYLKINLTKGVFSITATDSVNFVEYHEKGFKGGKDGEAVVRADQLIKLVEKTTKEEMTLTLKKDHLEVKGNGKYKVQLNTEDKFPEYKFNKRVKKHKVDTKILNNMFRVNESAIATEMVMPCLTGFNIGQKCTTTDGVKMCINEVEILKNKNILVTQQLADLISTVKDEKIGIQVDGEKLLFTTDTLTIFGTELDDKDDFPDITELADINPGNEATVNRFSLLETLGRLSLFVDPYDNNAVKLNFKSKNLVVSDLKDNSSEKVEYKDNATVDDGELIVSINFLITLLESLNEDNVTLMYNIDEDTPLVIRQEGITELLSTMEGDEDTEGEEAS